MKKKILITGAFGNLGLMCVHQALEMGFDVRCFDLDNKANKKVSAELSTKTEIILGDIRDESIQINIIQGVDAIIHNASVLPPITENNPDLARCINVDACKNLIKLSGEQNKKPVFIFPSSVTVFGLPEENESPRTVNDSVQATDNYTDHKLTIEETLKKSCIPWVVLRVGVSVDTRTLATDRKTFKMLLDVKPNNPFEYIHPKDVAYAMCQAVIKEKAKNKILLLGGGESCQITQRDFINTAFESLGIPLPLSVHGNEEFYTHWMDTAESQSILGFQRHTFEDYQKEMADKLRLISYILWPLRWLIRPILPAILSRL